MIISIQNKYKKYINYFFILMAIIILFFMLYYSTDYYIFEKYEKECTLYDEDIFQIDSGKDGPHILLLGGVHGNEKSGAIYLKEYIKNVNITSGKLTVIHTANKCGFKNNTRLLPKTYSVFHRDINRNFPKTLEDNAKDPNSKKILEYVDDADFILDFHEGYDFHKINKNSVGSTLTASGGCELSENITKYIVQQLNQNINPINKEGIPAKDREWTHVSSNPKSPNYIPNFELKGTLDYYCLIKNKNYILVEITGQKNKQEMDVRLDQIDIIINSFFNYLSTVSFNGKPLKDTTNLPCV